MGRMGFTLFLCAGRSRADLSQCALGISSDRLYIWRGGLAEASWELQHPLFLAKSRRRGGTAPIEARAAAVFAVRVCIWGGDEGAIFGGTVFRSARHANRVGVFSFVLSPSFSLSP